MRLPSYPIRSVARAVYVPVNSAFFDMMHVNEFPKSGGTWMSKMLAQIMGWRFDDNAYPRFGASVMKHHRLALNEKKTICMIRDPRDVAVSFFYHSRKVFDDDPLNKKSVELALKQASNSAGELDIDAFVRSLFTKPLHPRFTWSEFYSSEARKSETIIKYENLRSNPQDTMLQAFQAMGVEVCEQKIADVVDAHDIDKIISAREKAGDSGHHFVRKGAVGGWRDELSKESVEFIQEKSEFVMKQFGYE